MRPKETPYSNLHVHKYNEAQKCGSRLNFRSCFTAYRMVWLIALSCNVEIVAWQCYKLLGFICSHIEMIRKWMVKMDSHHRFTSIKYWYLWVVSTISYVFAFLNFNQLIDVSIYCISMLPHRYILFLYIYLYSEVNKMEINLFI